MPAVNINRSSLCKEEYLAEYLESLDKTLAFDIQLVLPGHRKPFKNCKERIQELKLHHRKRAKEVLSILGKGSQDAFQVASQMSWDLTYDSWDQFPVPQKWFATGNPDTKNSGPIGPAPWPGFPVG